MTEQLNPPTVTYEALEADLATRGLKATDLLGGDGHYERWRRRNRLSDKDGTPQQLYARYEADPAGAEAAPPHANLWHFLLKCSEPFPWTERPGSRTKNAPVCSAMFVEPEDLTEERIAEGRTKLEADAGGPIPDDAWRQFARDVRKGPAAARRCVQEIRDLLERHGVRHPQFGHIMQVVMTVDC